MGGWPVAVAGCAVLGRAAGGCGAIGHPRVPVSATGAVPGARQQAGHAVPGVVGRSQRPQWVRAGRLRNGCVGRLSLRGPRLGRMRRVKVGCPGASERAAAARRDWGCPAGASVRGARGGCCSGLPRAWRARWVCSDRPAAWSERAAQRVRRDGGCRAARPSGRWGVLAAAVGDKSRKRPPSAQRALRRPAGARAVTGGCPMGCYKPTGGRSAGPGAASGRCPPDRSRL